MRISDGSSDVCSSDLVFVKVTVNRGLDVPDPCCTSHRPATDLRHRLLPVSSLRPAAVKTSRSCQGRSEEHTSELQSLMRISYAVDCLKKQNTSKTNQEEMHTL